jgi:hypothetical protein
MKLRPTLVSVSACQEKNTVVGIGGYPDLLIFCGVGLRRRDHRYGFTGFQKPAGMIFGGAAFPRDRSKVKAIPLEGRVKIFLLQWSANMKLVRQI